MNLQLSTFDKLVDTLSTEEAQMMLASISDSMKLSADIQSENRAAEASFTTDRLGKELRLDDEPFFIRLWLKLKAFFRAIPVETIYEDELINRIGRDLNRKYKQYINIKHNIFTHEFYELLRELRKTQLFFTALLSAYDSDKGDFYLLTSSFAAPDIYAKLMYATDPFNAAVGLPASANLRADFLKKIDEVFSLILPESKNEMYQCAHAIEWMRHFCELPIDKTVLRFTVNPAGEASCAIHFIAAEISMLASVLNAIKPIRDIVLQALFLLLQQDRLNDKELDLEKESVEFVAQASHALEAIKHFSLKIPIIDFARYAARSVHWDPQRFDGGEDWFLLFKNAWKKRFNERWQLWSAEQKRFALKAQMLKLLKIEEIHSLSHRPWEDAWLVLRFKREFSFSFLVSFFSGLYPSAIQPVLKILLMEGKFYRRENLEDYTSAFTVLEKQESALAVFESRLGPEGELGAAFTNLKEKPMASLKSKNSLEALMKSVESEAKQLVAASQGALKTLIALLNGFIEGNKSSVYAPLLNWSIIQGVHNADFRAQVEAIKKLLQDTAVILTETEKIESEF